MFSKGEKRIRIELASALELLGVKYFSAEEVLFMGSGNESGKAKGLNHLPPIELVPNLAKVTTKADEIREAIKGPIRIISAFRSEAYNRKIGGAKNSWHIRGMALDLSQASVPHHVFKKVAQEVVGTSGGVGLYPSFVHIDCRGYFARW